MGRDTAVEDTRRGGGEKQSVVFGFLIVPPLTLHTEHAALYVSLLNNIKSIFNICLSLAVQF